MIRPTVQPFSADTVARRATDVMRRFGRGDAVRVGQAETYLPYLECNPMGNVWIRELAACGVTLDDVAGGVERSDARAEIDRAFAAWARRAGFKRSHIWLRGFVATALALRELMGPRDVRV
jgi:hypothetical protein